MQALRATFTVLMLVAVLPWGAYGAAFAARFAPLTVQVSRLAGNDTAAPHHGIARNPTITLTKQKCRTATLPGATCPPDPAVHTATAAAVPNPQRSGVLRRVGRWPGADPGREPPIGPPRLV